MALGRYFSLPILLAAVILQSTVMPEFQIRSGRADLIFTLILSWTLLAGMEQGIVWALVGGILQDLVSGMPLGTSALVLTVIMFAVATITGQIGRSNILIPPLVAAGSTAVYHLLLMILYSVLGRPSPMGYSLLNVTLPTVLLNTILILPVYRILGALFEAIRPRRVSV